MHCWWGESASYVLSLLKSFLMEWKPYILFPNEAQEWQTAPLGLSYGCLQVEATGPSQAAPREPAGDVRLGQQTVYTLYTYTQSRVNLQTKIQKSQMEEPGLSSVTEIKVTSSYSIRQITEVKATIFILKFSRSGIKWNHNYTGVEVLSYTLWKKASTLRINCKNQAVYSQ